MFKRLKSKYHDMNIEKMKVLREKRDIDYYVKSKLSVNNLSYWFPKVKDIGFKVTDTVVMPLSYDTFKWLNGGRYSDENISTLGEEIESYLKGVGFDVDRELFIKTGVYSTKFKFDWCKVDNVADIGTKFSNMYYDIVCLGVDKGSELVIREYIKSRDERPKICRVCH